MHLTQDMTSRYLILREKLDKRILQKENVLPLEMERLNAYSKMIEKQGSSSWKPVISKRHHTRDSIRLQTLRVSLEKLTKDMSSSPLLRVAVLKILLRRMYPKMQRI